MDPEVVLALKDGAETANERRLLVLAGALADRFEATESAIEAADIPLSEVTVVGPENPLDCEHLESHDAEDLLGSTRSAVVVDCHEACRPNVLGRTVGAVDGGGLYILLTPPLDEWPTRRDGFDETLAVPPDTVADVTGNFRTRLVQTLRDHPGIAIIDLDADRVVRDGLTDPPRASSRQTFEIPKDRSFPLETYEACLTQDQVEAVQTMECLRRDPTAVVLQADRGRGKSSAAGLVAATLANEGESVTITAPTRRHAHEVLARVRDLTGRKGSKGFGTLKPRPNVSLDDLTDRFEGSYVVEPADHAIDVDEEDRSVDARRDPIRYVPPDEVEPDDGVLIVDEAAALPVRLLQSYLDFDRIVFATTVHGYEGTGRGFDVRFREHLEDTDHEVCEARLDQPIRYAAGDPVEVWAFRSLLLDARPAPDDVVESATPDSARYREFTASELLEDENLLREVFGLLVYAHYRTEPDDLARLLDAPNITVRALVEDGHVVSVALLAREGGLDADTRSEVYEGSRIRGNMLPDVLMSQLRDEDAGDPIGLRVMRIATHHAVRSRGLGSRLLQEIREEFDESVDWLGTGFGATPELVDFWAQNGYGTVHLATTRNESSGEYSILMLDPLSDEGEQLYETHSRWFSARILDVFGDALPDMDPDVIRAALRACTERSPLHLGDREWRVVAGAAFGPAMYSIDPAPFRELVMHYLTHSPDLGLTAREERLLVRTLLQLQDWPTVAEELDYVSTSAAMRSLGSALQPLVEEYGTGAALEEAARYRD